MFVVVFTGLPGTGKSTLAEQVARRLRAPAFAGDWLMGALKPFGVLATLDRDTYGRLYQRLLWTLASRQLMLGQSAVMDCLATDALVLEWTEQATPLDGQLLVVECVCGDEGLHRSRLEGRKRGIPGWHEVDWDHVLRMRDEFPPVSSPHLILDSVNPLEENIQAVWELITG